MQEGFRLATEAPLTAAMGDAYLNTQTGTLMVYNGTHWVEATKHPPQKPTGSIRRKGPRQTFLDEMQAFRDAYDAKWTEQYVTKERKHGHDQAEIEQLRQELNAKLQAKAAKLEHTAAIVALARRHDAGEMDDDAYERALSDLLWD